MVDHVLVKRPIRQILEDILSELQTLNRNVSVAQSVGAGKKIEVMKQMEELKKNLPPEAANFFDALLSKGL